MKRLLSVLLCCVLICGVAIAEQPATPTDLGTVYEIFEDDDWGHIDHFNRQVFVEFLKTPQYYGEEVTLVAILVNFKPEDIYTFEWEYSEDSEVWYLVEDATDQTYTFIIDKDNSAYWWRVKVTFKEDDIL